MSDAITLASNALLEVLDDTRPHAHADNLEIVHAINLLIIAHTEAPRAPRSIHDTMARIFGDGINEPM